MVGDKAISFGITVVVVLILWFIARRLVKALTKSIETGAPVRSRQARKALAKMDVAVVPLDSTEARLEAERRRQRAHTLRVVFNSAITVLAVVVIVMALLSVLGIPVAPMLASAGIAGVALGFGAQSLVKDVLSGVFMLIEDQYGVGDIVDLGEAVGTVEEVGLRSTRLRSMNGTVWYVPNGEIQRVGNMTRLWSRVLLEVRFSYDTDVDAARQAMLDAVAAARKDDEVNASILSEPEVPGVESFEFNAFMMRLMVQVNPATQWSVQRAVRREMRTTFALRGIRLAVPDQAMIYDPRAAATVGNDTTARANHDDDSESAEPTTGTAISSGHTTPVPKQGDRPGASGRNMPDEDGE